MGKICGNDGDNYFNVKRDIQFLIDKLEILRKKRRDTPWYCIRTRIKLLKEIQDIEKEAEEIGERLKKLDSKTMNPIQLVKRV